VVSVYGTGDTIGPEIEVGRGEEIGIRIESSGSSPSGATASTSAASTTESATAGGAASSPAAPAPGAAAGAAIAADRRSSANRQEAAKEQNRAWRVGDNARGRIDRSRSRCIDEREWVHTGHGDNLIDHCRQRDSIVVAHGDVVGVVVGGEEIA